MRSNVAPTPIAPIPGGAADVEIVVATAVAPGSVVDTYTPEDMILNVDIAPGVVSVVNTSIVAIPVPTPPVTDNISPG